jgi:hypothetical protein
MADWYYWGTRRDASFWIENASVIWNEAQAPFHTVARLALLPKSILSSSDAEEIYFDVTGHVARDSTPVGSINRARCPSAGASRRARMDPQAHPTVNTSPHSPR